MLEYYVDSKFKLLQLRGCPVGKHMDCFADWLHAARYKRRPAQLLLRGAAHLGHWASIRKVRIDQLDSPVLDTFGRHIATCTCTHAFHGRGHYNEEGAKRFVEHLQMRGILPRPEVRPEPLPALIEAFSDWMRRHRGVAESTLTHYVPMVKEFLVALGDDTAAYNASLVRRFVFARASRTGHSGAKSVVNAIRTFLRFLAANASCSPELVAAVPRIVKWRLSSLPRYISAQDVERLIQGCDPALLIEDITLLKAEKITLQVRFKGGATTTLRTPLPLNAWQGRKTPEPIVALIDELLDRHTDAEVGELLKERGWVTGAGEKFSTQSVRWIRNSKGLKSYKERLKEKGMMTPDEISKHCEISNDTVKSRRKKGILIGRKCNDKGDWLYYPPPSEHLSIMKKSMRDFFPFSREEALFSRSWAHDRRQHGKGNYYKSDSRVSAR